MDNCLCVDHVLFLCNIPWGWLTISLVGLRTQAKKKTHCLSRSRLRLPSCPYLVELEYREFSVTEQLVFLRVCWIQVSWAVVSRPHQHSPPLSLTLSLSLLFSLSISLCFSPSCTLSFLVIFSNLSSSLFYNILFFNPSVFVSAWQFQCSCLITCVHVCISLVLSWLSQLLSTSLTLPHLCFTLSLYSLILSFVYPPVNSPQAATYPGSRADWASGQWSQPSRRPWPWVMYRLPGIM